MIIKSRFDRFEQNHRRFNIMFAVAAAFIALVFVMIFAWFAFVGYLAVTASDQVEQVGIRGVVERLWCGKQPNCSLPTGDHK